MHNLIIAIHVLHYVLHQALLMFEGLQNQDEWDDSAITIPIHDGSWEKQGPQYPILKVPPHLEVSPQ